MVTEDNLTTIPMFGPYGSSALNYVDSFSRYGANACWFHGFDLQAFAICQAHGIQACVEFKTFRADFNARPDLIPIGVDGQPIRFSELVQGVCLSRSDFLEETEAHLVEGLRLFQPAGIWLDYLTYAGWFETPAPDLQESCFCADCVADFCAETGIDAESPQEILRRAGAEWTRHKCRRVAALARRYAELIHASLPECIVGAYMCPWLPEEFDGALKRIFAQDYSLLAPWIDVFTPLIYAHKSGRTSDWGRRFLEAAPGFIPPQSNVQLILDVLDFPDSLLATVESSVPSWGLQLFGGGRVFSDPAQAEIYKQAAFRWAKAWGFWFLASAFPSRYKIGG
jgi:hypothetical protein